MNQLSRLAGAEPIRLSDEPDFSFGEFEVQPSLREVRWSGRKEQLEPRVMQVLVALARADGAVVSRDELIRLCWEGRIVGEAAINRCIWKLRELADAAGKTSFQIETIPRVGYRLLADGMKLSESAPRTGQRLKKIVAAQIPMHSDSAEATETFATGSPVTVTPRRLPWKSIGAALAVVLVAAAAIAAGGWLLRRPRPANWTVAHSEVVVANSLMAQNPAISPDGNMFAYSAGKDLFSRKIHVQRIARGESLKFTDDAYDDVSPTWSPDGSQIAYTQFRLGERCRILIKPFPAGSPREVARCRTDARSHVSWSSDGNLYFPDSPDEKSASQEMRVDPVTGELTQVTHPPRGSLWDGEPSLSPDGRWVGFRRDVSDAVSQFVVVDLRTGAERVLIPDANMFGSAWSDDSQTVFVTTQKGYDNAIWAWPLNGAAPKRILSSPEFMPRLGSGPHGLLAIEMQQLYTSLAASVDSADGNPHYLDPERGLDFSSDIAPDGTIALTADRPEGAGLWLKPKDGPFRKLIALDDGGGETRWSPDGSRIAFQVAIRGRPGIRVVTAAGLEMASIAFHGSMMNAHAWSADGHALIFPGYDAQGWRLWRVELAHPGRVLPLPYRGWDSVRTRNDEIYGTRDDGADIWRIDGAPRKVFDSRTTGMPYRWTIAGDEIVWVDKPGTLQARILARPIAGGAVRVVAQAPRACLTGGIAVDPETRSVLYTALVSIESDIELLHLARN
ncbi:MAG TPA: winged helix-turn-helix domain-containing protein [Rhizomicrobium sp.]|jgi:DNA-binding winged helix-turn-helix (wHTH) protein/Tol biopolymer transport system component